MLCRLLTAPLRPLHRQFKAISVSYGVLASPETRQEHDEAVRVRARRAAVGVGTSNCLCRVHYLRNRPHPRLTAQDFKDAYPGKWKPAASAI